jgi:hypothetical protein
MTFSEMQAYLLRRFDWDSTDTTQVLSIKDALNDVHAEVYGLLRDSPWLETNTTEAVTGSSTTVDLSAFAAIRGAALYNTANTFMLTTNLSMAEWIMMNGHPSLLSRNTPSYLVIDSVASGVAGQRVLRGTLLPYPDGAYTFWCYGQAAITDLSADADVPFFPAPFHRVIPNLAAPRLMHEEGFNPDLAKLLQRSGERMLESLLLAQPVVTDPTTTVPRIGP